MKKPSTNRYSDIIAGIVPGIVGGGIFLIFTFIIHIVY